MDFEAQHLETTSVTRRPQQQPVDPKRELEDRCKAPCTRPLKEYQACAKRIQGDESGHKHCTDNTLITGAVLTNA
ncbi:hypothetical protein DH2020_030872 [Rehmannia glutinosa]|uniref:Ubiquinol-cytochrome C reductase hinge domain-containing protein n=1 Tax=Rehmannia glutinosa TaxID=99300 RepID=A0ABR0VM08_REHGL